MALHFLVDDGSASSAEPDDVVVIVGAEAHHAAAVRRVRPGEAVTIGDGRGVWLEGSVESVEQKSVVVRISVRREVDASSTRLVLVQALAKGDRDELAVQAATELGVDAIVPWQAQRSVSRWDAAKAPKAVARWQSIVREASKQAHRAWVPQVSTPVSTAQLAALPGRLVVLEPTASRPLTGIDLAGAEDVVVVVGPEGGIAPDELETLTDAGAVLARLGDTVLRTSTAGPAAIAVVNARLQRW